MQKIVKVTRRGQTTITANIRKKFKIKAGDKLSVEATEDGILFRIIPHLEDMASIDANFGKSEDMKKKVDKLKEEY